MASTQSITRIVIHGQTMEGHSMRRVFEWHVFNPQPAQWYDWQAGQRMPVSDDVVIRAIERANRKGWQVEES